jgi:PIN domain nuclease of toxin-antitoxin system
MNSFDEGDTKKNWIALRVNLNIARDFFKPLEKLSVLNRHGSPFELSFIDRQICIYTAMIVLQRYLHYLDEGWKQLDMVKYPVINTIHEFGIKGFN